MCTILLAKLCGCELNLFGSSDRAGDAGVGSVAAERTAGWYGSAWRGLGRVCTQIKPFVVSNKTLPCHTQIKPLRSQIKLFLPMHPQCDSCWGHWAARPSVSKKNLFRADYSKKTFAPTGLCGVQAIGSPHSQSTQILIQDPGSRILGPGP